MKILLLFALYGLQMPFVYGEEQEVKHYTRQETCYAIDAIAGLATGILLYFALKALWKHLPN